MGYVNVGARLRTGHPKSKKAVRDAIAAGEEVIFYSTEAFGNAGRRFTVRGDEHDIPQGVTLSLCGPDPYNRRNFYGSVTVGKDGRVKVA